MTEDKEIDPTAPAVETLSLLEETASVSTRDVVTGWVRVSTHIETVNEIARAVLHSEDVEVIRVPFNQMITGAAPQPRTEGDLTIIPIVEEVLVVETRLVLKEEVHIRKTRAVESVQVPVTLRRQHAVVDRSNS